jgi:hypothetical protein
LCVKLLRIFDHSRFSFLLRNSLASMKFTLASAFVASAEAGTLAVTWADCGAKHATVTDLEPTTIQTGSTETLTGTGTTDEEVTAAHFEATVSAAGAKLASCSGDGTADIACKLPLGAGTVTVKAVNFPLAKGTVNILTSVQTSSLIPASLAKVDVHIAATEQNGESVICLDVHTAKQLGADIDCTKSACQDQCECSLVKCADEIDACMAVPNCAASQDCALACPCSDNACMLKCAAASPSIKALPAARCINKQCGSTLAV